MTALSKPCLSLLGPLVAFCVLCGEVGPLYTPPTGLGQGWSGAVDSSGPVWSCKLRLITAAVNPALTLLEPCPNPTRRTL
ncbi:hypothetical protein DL95DRAFT_396864, partial [Leptodontidium sp. 2 PMI_412]